VNRDIRDEYLIFWNLFVDKRFIFFSKKNRDWDCFASLMIPLFAKNSRLGYFFGANNPQGESYSP
jgi:hypothetical protein